MEYENKEQPSRSIQVSKLTLEQMTFLAEHAHTSDLIVTLQTELNRRSVGYADTGNTFKDDEAFMRCVQAVEQAQAAFALEKTD